MRCVVVLRPFITNTVTNTASHSMNQHPHLPPTHLPTQHPTHSMFSNNTSEKDGAAFLVKDRRSGIHLNGSIFNGNEAQSLGAAVAAYQDTTLTVHGSDFNGGLATKGMLLNISVYIQSIFSLCSVVIFSLN